MNPTCTHIRWMGCQSAACASLHGGQNAPPSPTGLNGGCHTLHLCSRASCTLVEQCTKHHCPQVDSN